MDNAISTALLTIAVVVASVMVINAILPGSERSGASMLSSARAASEIAKTDVEIVAVVPFSTEVYVWIKNAGASEIEEIDKSDVFFEDVGASFKRMTHDSGQDGTCGYVPSTPDKWAYCIEDGESIWNPGATVKITIVLGPPPTGQYQVQFVTSNGVVTERSFSV